MQQKKRLLIILLIAGTAFELLWSNVLELVHSGNYDMVKEILIYFRLPRVLNALIAGAGLAMSGLVLQTIFHNPLAGPYVLGISSGSAMGVAISVMVLSSGSHLLSFVGMYLFAIAGALGVIAILTLLARRYSMVAVIITGVLLAGIFSAIINILQFFAPSFAVKKYVIWTMASVDMSNYYIISVNGIFILLSIIVLLSKTHILDGFYFGEDYAMSMGIDVRKQRLLLIILVGLIITLLTASYGPLAFVGVISPHLSRWLSGKQTHRPLFIHSLLIGSIIMVWSDFLSHAFAVAIPINSILSLMGLPVLLILILRREYNFF